ncbi:tetratricopeptide repeat protein [Brevibacillus ginsengisoli]|uniref:tetratricopeptide repeat protein n=1 Tax=Brevibacillus ginsengisoli TaxID=363854 RepID=UPI003CF96415
MELLDLNSISVISGISVVLIVLFARLHWPFRYQYMSSFFKRNASWRMRPLQASFKKNKTLPVAFLDKSTVEILSGNYLQAEKFIAQGLNVCKDTPSLFNQAMMHYLFYNLSAVYFYCGRYTEALEIAFHVYERDNKLISALGIIVCAHARLGDVQGAVEAYQLVATKKLKEELRLICQAEIEAAKGDYQQAVTHMKQLAIKNYMNIMHLNQGEIDKRLQEWTKASSTQAG